MPSREAPARFPVPSSEWRNGVGQILDASPWPAAVAELARLAAEEPSRDELAFFAVTARFALRDVPPPPTDADPQAMPYGESHREAERAATAARGGQAWVERVKLRWPRLAMTWLLVGRCSLWLGDPESALGAFRRAALSTSTKQASAEELALTETARLLDGRAGTALTALEVWTEAFEHGLRSNAWGDQTFRVRVMGDVIGKEGLPRDLRRRALEARAFSRGGRAAVEDLRTLIQWRADDDQAPRTADHLRLARELFALGEEPAAVESVRAACAIEEDRIGEVLASTELRAMLGSELLWSTLGRTDTALAPGALRDDLRLVHGAWISLAARGQLGALRGDDVGTRAMAAAARAYAAATALADPRLLVEAMSQLGALVTMHRDADLGLRWLERASALAEETLTAEPLERAEVRHRLGVGQLWSGEGRTMPGGPPAPEIERAAASLEAALSLRLAHDADPLSLARSYGDLARVEVVRQRLPEAARRLADARAALLRGLELVEAQPITELGASRRLDAIGNLALVTTHRAEVALALGTAVEDLGSLIDDALDRALQAQTEGLSFEAIPPRIATLIGSLPAPGRASRRKRLRRLLSPAVAE